MFLACIHLELNAVSSQEFFALMEKKVGLQTWLNCAESSRGFFPKFMQL
jgi:hypothetical protein